MKKNEDGFINFNDLNPDVSGAIERGRRQQAARHMTPAQRRKAAKDAARNRRMLDIPPEIEDEIEQMANEIGVPFSSLAVFLLERGKEHTSMEELIETRKPTRSMRYEFVLPYEEKKKKRK